MLLANRPRLLRSVLNPVLTVKRTPKRPQSTMPPPPPAPPTSTKPKPPSPSPTPRLSASLLLLDSQNRILLVQRSSAKSMSFSSAIVFPGGNLDPIHDSFLLPAESGCLPLPTTTTALHEPLPEDLLTALKTCAIRETFEEAGVLLACPTTAPPSQPDLASIRSTLLNQHPTSTSTSTSTSTTSPPTPTPTPTPTPFSTLLSRANLTISPSSLHQFTTWITPPHLPRRYHTSMFLAFLPADHPITTTPSTTCASPHPPANNTDEIISTRWLAPQQLLSLYHSQFHSQTSQSQSPKPRLILFPPQLYLLTILSRILSSPPSSSSSPRDEILALAQGEFGRKVIQPYTKRVLEGEEKGKVLLGLDRPRGVVDSWVKVKFGKGGPEEVQVVERREEGESKL